MMIKFRDKAAVLFMTHTWDRLMHLKFERLRLEVGDIAEVRILMQKSNAVERFLLESPSLKNLVTIFDLNLLPKQLGYPYSIRNSMLPGSVHFPIINFFRMEKEFSSVFVIENDMEFSGNWGELISKTIDESPDFASLHFFSFEEKPEWMWWRYCQSSSKDNDWFQDNRNWLRSFNPIYCLSRKAAELADIAHRSGWRGHQEFILATIFSYYGLKVIDFGELGGFYQGSEQDHFGGIPLTDMSTVRWRPPVKQQEFLSRATGSTLFHPVKEPWFFDGENVVSFTPAP